LFSSFPQGDFLRDISSGIFSLVIIVFFFFSGRFLQGYFIRDIFIRDIFISDNCFLIFIRGISSGIFHQG